MLTNSIVNDIKHHLRYGNVVVKLILVNSAVFLFVNLFYLVLLAFSAPSVGSIPEEQLSLPMNFPQLLRQPWSIITYMFMHAGVFHILFNMLWLYWFGEIFLFYLNEKKILPLYFSGGIAGALLALLAVNFIPAFSIYKTEPMVGASAAVIAVVFAAATLNPDHEVQLLFFGRVRLKYVALIPLLIDVVSIRYGNVGGYVAHVGGAVTGMLYISYLRSGIIRLLPFKNIFSRKPKMKVSHKTSEPKRSSSRQADEQKRIDEILDKISRSGYDSLSKEEKDFLFNYSKK